MKSNSYARVACKILKYLNDDCYENGLDASADKLNARMLDISDHQFYQTMKMLSDVGLEKGIKIFVAGSVRRSVIQKMGLDSPNQTDTHHDIIATLAGYDIVRANKYAVELNVMNRGKLEWKLTSIKNIDIK